MKVLCNKRLVCKWAVSCQHASIPHEPDTNCEAKYCLLGKMEHECNDLMPERRKQ